MALRTIRLDGDEILRKISKPVQEINNSIKELIDDLFETLHSAGNGVGLAAPQVGILKRIIVINMGDGPIEIINPEIISSDGELNGIEGCLSLPDVWGEVTRPRSIVVKGLNREGDIIEIQAKEMLARVICHEVDHLNGILFKDKVTKYVDIEGKR